MLVSTMGELKELLIYRPTGYGSSLEDGSGIIAGRMKKSVFTKQKVIHISPFCLGRFNFWFHLYGGMVSSQQQTKSLHGGFRFSRSAHLTTSYNHSFLCNYVEDPIQTSATKSFRSLIYFFFAKLN